MPIYGITQSSCNKLGLCIDGANGGLDRVDLRFVEINLAALLADECRHFVKNEMITLAVDVERSNTALHFAFTVHALHTLKPSSENRQTIRPCPANMP